MSVLQLLTQAVNQIIAVYALAISIVSNLITSGWYLVVRDAATVTQDIHDILDDPTCGQAAQCSKLDSLLSDVATLASDIAALGNPQQSLVAVTLPTTPPVGYGGGATAAEVWSFVLASYGNDASDALSTAANVLRNLSGSQMVAMIGPGNLFGQYGDWDDNTGGVPLGDPPLPSTILSTDSDAATWLNREFAFWSPWSMFDGYAVADTGHGDRQIICLLSQYQFERARYWAQTDTIGPVSPTGSGAPVWPGLSNVTLGSAHAMVPPGEKIAVDCDGVIIAVTGVPSWAGSFSFGTAVSYRNVGAVTFTTDNGQQEFAQTFSWTSGIYLPRATSHASGYAYRAAIGVSGTITPFTIN